MRQPMVTRTLKSSKVKVLCVDIDAEKPFYTEVKLAGTYKKEAKILAKAKEILETETVKVVNVTSVEVESALYGMSEQRFMENADILPNRTASTPENK